jgi:hypothetical protein
MPLRLAAPFAFLALLAALSLWLGALPARVYCLDPYVFYDVAWRMLHGQLVHHDIYSPLGPVAYLPHCIGLRLQGHDGFSLGRLSVSLPFLIPGILLAARLRPAAGIPISFLLPLLALAPYPLGFSSEQSGQPMFYNRLAYLILITILLAVLDESRKWHAYAGAALAVLLFLKVSYFLVALALIVLARPKSRHWPAAFAVAFLSLSPLIGFDYPSWFHDLRMAAQVKTAGIREQPLILALPDAALSLATLLAVAWPSGRVLLLSTAALSDLALLATNTQPQSLPLFLVAILLLAAPLFTRRPPAAALVLLSFSTGILFYRETNGFLQAALHRNDPQPQACAATLSSGLHLLNAHTKPTEKVAALAFLNPFPYLQHRPPTQTGAAWLHEGFTFSEKLYPPPEKVISDATAILVTTDPALRPKEAEKLRRLYRPYLESNFEEVAENPSWTLLLKRTP